MTRAKFIVRANAMGVTVIDTPDYASIIAPHKHTFTSGCHEHTVHKNPSWKASDVWNELARDLGSSVCACEDKDCEWCESGDRLPFGVKASDVLCGCKVEELP